VARYLARVEALGGELVMECQKELIPLIATLGVADRLARRDHPLLGRTRIRLSTPSQQSMTSLRLRYALQSYETNCRMTVNRMVAGSNTAREPINSTA
jgi:hypothetical protein